MTDRTRVPSNPDGAEEGGVRTEASTVVGELRHVMCLLLDAAEADPTTAAHMVADAYEALHGTQRFGHDLIPYEDRVNPIEDRLPKVMAWCVVKEHDGRLDRVWVAFEAREQAEAWREFLEDYYRSVPIRDGEERWVVRRMRAKASQFARDRLLRYVGHTYYRDRHPWVGTLPMEKYEWDQEAHRWVRMQGASGG